MRALLPFRKCNSLQVLVLSLLSERSAFGPCAVCTTSFNSRRQFARANDVVCNHVNKHGCQSKPNIRVTDSTLFSEPIEQPQNFLSKLLPRVTVVFFPGDVSDLATNKLALQKPEWSLESLHSVVASRFPKCSVMTVRGELSLGRRSFNKFSRNVTAATENLNSLLAACSETRGNPLQSKVVLVGFSRGGVGLTALIDGAYGNVRFWKRVEAVHYVDVGGDNSFVSDGEALRVLAKYNRRLWFNFPSTKYEYCARYNSQKDQMILMLREAGLRVEADEVPVASFADHFNLLTYFSIKRNV